MASHQTPDRPTATIIIALAALIVLSVALSSGSTSTTGPGADVVPPRQSTGTISGRVTTATMPADAAAVQTDQAICGKTQPDPSLVRSADGGVAWAVVLVTGASASTSASPSVTNRKCRFDPHVQVALPGQTLTMDSEDQTLHTTHAYGERDRSLFNIAIPMPGLKITRPLERDPVVRLGCDTHPWMRGYVVVSNELSAVSDARGAFTIANVPPGSREVRIWHERLKAGPQKVTVTAGATAEVTFTLTHLSRAQRVLSPLEGASPLP